MKIHTTNYQNTLIEVAEDCPVGKAEIPPLKGEKRTLANLQFEILNGQAYKYTSDEVIFAAYAEKNQLTESEIPEAKAAFFSKGQPCFRTSPLTKRYGFGIHNNAEGKIALVELGSEEYEKLVHDNTIMKVKAMRTTRKK